MQTADAKGEALMPRPAPLALKILNPCPSCGAEMAFKFSFGGDEEGRFMTSIYQCPKCKEIEAR